MRRVAPSPSGKLRRYVLLCGRHEHSYGLLLYCIYVSVPYTQRTINEEPWVRGRRRKALGPSLLLVVVVGTALVYLWLAGYVTKAKPGCFTKAEDRSRTQVHTPVPALSRCGFADASWAEPPSTWRPSISQDKDLLRLPVSTLLIRPGELAVSLPPVRDLSGIRL
jgi:hypothetical protein